VARRTPQLLKVRLFDERTKVGRYEQQKTEGQGRGRVQLSPVRDRRDPPKDAHLQLDEMDADHVAAWSKRGRGLKECEMLCVPQPSQRNK